jgi:hypothetical protein
MSFSQPSKVSLSNNAGRDFLKEVRNNNSALKNHIDNNRDFINLIYEFREKVIHRAGLERKISPIVAHWSNFIEISKEIRSYMKNCGDKKSPYKRITEWGAVEKQDTESYYLDPFYFAKNAAKKLIEFSNNYLQLINYTKFSDNIAQSRQSDQFMKDLEYFRNNTLRM